MGDEPSAAEIGLTTKDMGIRTEIKRQEKNLKGEDLSPDWPQITPDEEYRYRFEGFTPGVDTPIKKFSLYLQQGSKELAYLAVEHTNNSENPQFKALEANFRTMTPQVVLHEGPPNRGLIPDRETAIKYGETAFLHFLVQEHNANLQEGQQPIVIESADMPDAEWVQSFRNRGYTNEEIVVYDVLRQVNVVAEQIRRNNTLTDEQKSTKLRELTAQINTDFPKYMTERGFPNLFDQLPVEGREWNTETIKEAVKRQTGQNLSANLNQLNIPRFKEMFDEETEFRDKYVVEKIADKVRGNDKVMAVMGSSHVLREERALKEFFGVE